MPYTLLYITSMEELTLRVLSLLLLVSYSNGLQSPPACSSEGVECEYDENNLVDSVSQVYSEEECRQICEDQQELGKLSRSLWEQVQITRILQAD